jgi:protein TonB
METVARPEIPRIKGVNIAQWIPPVKAPVKEAPVRVLPAEASPAPMERASPDFATSSSYLEMVKLKIERYKKYPETARVARIEGSVTVRFKIRPSGNVSGVRVIKTSNHDDLDHAALKAVKDAAPFPRPPERFFKGAIPLKLTIVFELT